MADPLLRFWLHRWLKCQWVMIPWPSSCHQPHSPRTWSGPFAPPGCRMLLVACWAAACKVLLGRGGWEEEEEMTLDARVDVGLPTVLWDW